MARYFITFKPNTSLHKHVMMVHGITKNDVHHLVTKEYAKAVDSIYDEPTFNTILKAKFQSTNQLVEFGTECIFTEIDCNGVSTNEIKYPVSLHTLPYKPHMVSVADITLWFKTAKPYPTQANLFTQLGSMYEEVAESVDALNHELIANHASDQNLAPLHTKVQNALFALKDLASAMYKSDGFPLSKDSKIALLDALADITVTTTGSAQYAGFDFDGALTEVNRSNWSKFENGKPVLREDGKIMKGKDYFPPSLEQFIGNKK